MAPVLGPVRNAGQIHGRDIDRSIPVDQQIVQWDETEGKYVLASGVISSCEEITASQTLEPDKGYIVNGTTMVLLTLPTAMTKGQRIKIVGKGAGCWKVLQNSGQQIVFDVSATTSGVVGYIEALYRYAVLEIVCVTDNTVFLVDRSVGMLEVS